MFFRKMGNEGFILDFKIISIFYYKFTSSNKKFYKKLVYEGNDEVLTGYNFIYKKRGIGIIIPKVRRYGFEQ